jgi:hypothetical protein
MALNAARIEKPEIVMIDDKDDIPTNDIEKTAQVRIIDSIHVLGLSEDDAAFYNSITQDQRKRIIRKVRNTKQKRLCSEILTLTTLLL